MQDIADWHFLKIEGENFIKSHLVTSYIRLPNTHNILFTRKI